MEKQLPAYTSFPRKVVNRCRSGPCPERGSEEIYPADPGPRGLLAGDGQPLLRICKDKGLRHDVVIEWMSV